MGRLQLVDGIPRTQPDPGALPTIYDETLLVVASSPGTGEILGPITTGTPITLPDSKIYSGDELEVYLDGNRLVPVLDYNYDSSTQVSFTFQLMVGDLIRFRVDRNL